MYVNAGLLYLATFTATSARGWNHEILNDLRGSNVDVVVRSHFVATGPLQAVLRIAHVRQKLVVRVVVRHGQCVPATDSQRGGVEGDGGAVLEDDHDVEESIPEPDVGALAERKQGAGHRRGLHVYTTEPTEALGDSGVLGDLEAGIEAYREHGTFCIKGHLVQIGTVFPLPAEVCNFRGFCERPEANLALICKRNRKLGNKLPDCNYT